MTDPTPAPLSVSEAFSVELLLGHGYRMLQQAPAPLLIGAFLLFLVEACSGGGGQVNLPGDTVDFGGVEETGDPMADLAALFDAMLDQVGGLALAAIAATMVGCGVLLQAVMWIAKSFLRVGWIRMHHEVLTTGDADPNILFTGKDRLWPTALWYLLAATIRFGVFVVSASPGGALVAVGGWQAYSGGREGAVALILAGVFLIFLLWLPTFLFIQPALVLGDRAVVLDGRGPLEALDLCWSMVSGHRLSIILYLLASAGVNFLGILACCVGVIPATAVVQPGLTAGWMLCTRGDRHDWALCPPGT